MKATYAYNAADQPIYVTSPPPGNGQPAQSTSTYYSSMMRATNVVYADGGSVTNEFFTTGALKKTSGSRTYPVEYTYDPQGRMKTMKTWQNFAGNSGAATTTWHYNERGFLTRKEYADTNGPEYTYNDAGKLLTRKWARGTPTRLTTTYAYNNAGDLWTTAYNDGVTPGVTNLYDRRGRLNSIAFNGTITSNIFHYGGGVLAETNFGGTLDGISVTNAFDGYLRKSAVGVHGYPATLNAYTYDTAGRLATVSDGTNSATYSYIANSPLVGQIAFKENTTTRMTTVKKYDHLNRLSSIVSTPSAANEVPIAFEYAYNDANQRTRVTMEDGSFWIYKYDKLGQVTSGKRYWVDGTPVAGQQFEYAFDDIGNRTTTKEGGDATGTPTALRTSTYALKPNLLNQYDQRTVPNAVDVMGVAKTAATVTVDGFSAYRNGPYFHKALGIDNSATSRFPAIIASASLSGSTDNSTGRVFVAKTPETFSYDLDGNTIQDGRWIYKWDGENRLIEMISLTNTPTESKLWLKFWYDSGGRRIQKTVAQYTNSAWSLVLSNRYAYSGWNELGELNATNNALLSGNLWGLDLSTTLYRAGGVGGLICFKGASGGSHMLAFDGIGNTSGLVDASNGATSGRYEYGPSGEEVRSSGSASKFNEWRHSTKRKEPHTEHLYYGLRYARSGGGWMSRDLIGEFGGLNLYAVVNNDRVNKFDLVGLSPGEGEFKECGGCTGAPWKSVTVKVVVVHGSTRDSGADFTNADEVYEQCCVKVERGARTTLTEEKSTAALGANLKLETGVNSPTREETALTQGQGSDLAAYYISGFDFDNMLGRAYPEGGAGYDNFPPAFILGNKLRARGDTFAHELGHMLMGMTSHEADVENLMASGDRRQGSKLKEAQCKAIRGSKFVK